MDLPREKVVQLISDPAQMPKWLRGLVLHEPVNGVARPARDRLASRVPDGQAVSLNLTRRRSRACLGITSGETGHPVPTVAALAVPGPHVASASADINASADPLTG